MSQPRPTTDPWEHVWQVRQQALEDYYRLHPARFHYRPVTPAPAGVVGSNLPSEEAGVALQAA